MIYLTALFLFVVLAIGCYTFFVLPQSDKPFGVASLFVLLLAVVYLGNSEMLGRPKPVHVEFTPLPKQVEVIAFTWVEGEAIYLWVQLDAPRAYVLPWDLDIARQIQAGMEGAQANGGTMMAEGMFDQTEDGELMFYEKPQEKYPDKQAVQ